MKIFSFLFLSLFCLPVAIATSAEGKVACPKFRSVREVVDTAMKAELMGLRLKSDTMDKFSQCIETDNVNAWDTMIVVSDFTLSHCKSSEASCVLVKYTPLANMGSDFVIKPIKLEMGVSKSFEVKAIQVSKIWKLSGFIDLPPLVTSKSMVEFLEERQNELPKNKALRAAIERLKKL
ncbi:hypothetical protein GW915_13690 [bacterium]|nr:hypothetical protein [bacterium]